MPVEILKYNGLEWRFILGGGAPVSADPFIDKVTMPENSNSGVPESKWGDLHVFDPTGTKRLQIITQPGNYSGEYFGNCKVAVRSAGVTFDNCVWDITDAAAPSADAVIMAVSSAVANLDIRQCTIRNRDQMGYNLTGIQGHDMEVYRTNIQGTMDGISPYGGANWSIRSNFISNLGWWATPTGGVVHTKDVQTHQDGIQIMQSGANCEIIGNSIFAYPSTTVGTGTPNSGSDSGNAPSWYTQAQAEARRAELLTGRTPLGKSYDGLVHELGGNIVGIMVNHAAGPAAVNVKIEDNWGGGGGNNWLNGRDAGLIGNMGTIKRNKLFADMTATYSGKPLGVAIVSTATVDMPTTGADKNIWLDDASTIVRYTP